jgi:hypothetical protein
MFSVINYLVVPFLKVSKREVVPTASISEDIMARI